MLVTPNSGDNLPDVPRGRKVNCSFLVDNRTNVNREASNQKNRFWDDCGVWDTKQGRNPTSTYVRTGGISGYSQQAVTKRDNMSCVKRRINKTLVWLLLLRHKTADEVAAALREHIILRVSVPSAILTDQGKEFTGAVVHSFLSLH